MEQFDIYSDIAARTNGDIYIGVVGPVRTGKSTFVTKVMESLVLPNIKNKNARQRATDELPQAGDGKTVMTTQPKFVPNEAVKIKLNGAMNVNVRLIDCVGYPVEGAEGFSEQDKMRMVKTPWSEEDMPFEQAAELGTQKVIAEHSTIAVVVTNDGTITDIPRSKYVSAEERVVKELRKTDKPFIVVLNSKNPSDPDCRSLADALEKKYGVRVLPMDVKNMSAGEVEEVLKKILEEFPIRKLVMNIPKWMQTLKMGNWLISSIIEKIKNNSKEMNKMKDYGRLLEGFTEDENLFMPEVDNMKMGEGVVTYKVEAKPQLFYKVLSDFAGSDIGDEFSLMKFVSECSYAKQQYDRIESALKNGGGGRLRRGQPVARLHDSRGPRNCETRLEVRSKAQSHRAKPAYNEGGRQNRGESYDGHGAAESISVVRVPKQSAKHMGNQYVRKKYVGACERNLVRQARHHAERGSGKNKKDSGQNCQ